MNKMTSLRLRRVPLIIAGAESPIPNITVGGYFENQ